jgi:hypothetical protein
VKPIQSLITNASEKPDDISFSGKEDNEWSLADGDEPSPITNILPLQKVFGVECKEAADQN